MSFRDNVENDTPYKSAASLGKVKQSQCALSYSLRKRKHILQSLGLEYGIEYGLSTLTSPINTALSLTSKTMELVTNLYLSDSISHVLLDKAETIIIQSVGCPKRKETKRHLIVNTSEAYELFRNDHPDIGLGKSKFAELRPKHILLSSDIPNNV